MDDEPQLPATKKTRGGAKLNFLTKLKRGEKVPLEFSRSEPAGPNTSKISAYCAKLAQNGENFPFDITDWSEIPEKEEKIEEPIAELKTVFEYSDDINTWVEKKLHDKSKSNKCKMRLKHHDENKTFVQNITSCPDEVIDTQWANMCKHWNTPEFKKKSADGTTSRKHLVMPHRAGTMSFVNHAIEIETTTEKKATRYVVFQKVYSPKEGKTPNPIVEEKRAQMEALEREDLEENGSDNDISILEVTSLDQLNGGKYSKIMGTEKPGRIRGVGSGICVTKLKGGSSSNVGQNNEENAALIDEIKKLKENQMDMQKNMEEERLQMEKTVDDMKKANEESQKKN
ncbi:hypothetical protein MKW94_022406 [Papaver nudicaule]|uniref:Transposase, Ptta/En/Spm, plant n=1 Tax=Papaver nudicaule TaxID=74823 RepID=A0AA41W3C1_PAPNU|nr:hypothetical protein [Papaver nudicaule]